MSAYSPEQGIGQPGGGTGNDTKPKNAFALLASAMVGGRWLQTVDTHHEKPLIDGLRSITLRNRKRRSGAWNPDAMRGTIPDARNQVTRP